MQRYPKINDLVGRLLAAELLIDCLLEASDLGEEILADAGSALEARREDTPRDIVEEAEKHLAAFAKRRLAKSD